jgi:hypothetical protein
LAEVLCGKGMVEAEVRRWRGRGDAGGAKEDERWEEVVGVGVCCEGGKSVWR